MRKIIDYTVILNSYLPHFIQEVNIAIAEGWQPYGGQALRDNSFLQAMVKYEEEKEQPVHMPPVVQNLNTANMEIKDGLWVEKQTK